MSSLRLYLKVDLMGLDIGGENKEKVQVDPQTLGMRDWKDRVVLYPIQS